MQKVIQTPKTHFQKCAFGVALPMTEGRGSRGVMAGRAGEGLNKLWPRCVVIARTAPDFCAGPALINGIHAHPYLGASRSSAGLRECFVS